VSDGEERTLTSGFGGPWIDIGSNGNLTLGRENDDDANKIIFDGTNSNGSAVVVGSGTILTIYGGTIRNFRFEWFNVAHGTFIMHGGVITDNATALLLGNNNTVIHGGLINGSIVR
jgi:hypothetical protein